MRLYPGFMQTELEPLSPSLPPFSNCILTVKLSIRVTPWGEGDKEVDREGNKKKRNSTEGRKTEKKGRKEGGKV